MVRGMSAARVVRGDAADRPAALLPVLGRALPGGPMSTLDKDYPIDRFMPALFWPMEQACRVRSRALKVLLMLLYVPWCVVFELVAFPLLVVSAVMEAWDEVNESPTK
jgi:hypothetical protein